jgi:hypothetical protein
MVDNFNDNNPHRNSLDLVSTANTGLHFKVEEEILYTYQEYHVNNYVETNRAKKFTYNYSMWSDDFVYTSYLCAGTDYLDASDYRYLSFRVKGERGGEDFYIRIEYYDPIAEVIRDNIKEVHSSDYVSITNEWQQVNIPLINLVGLEKKKLKTVKIIFRQNLSVPKGILYLDNLAFTKVREKPEGTGLVRIDREAKTLFVDNKPFFIKGVGYHPVGIGYSCTEPYPIGIYDRDFPLLRDMGFNTIRTWGEPGEKLIDKAEEYGLKVIAGFWMNSKDDYADPVVRDDIKHKFEVFIDTYKEKPALLIWAIGNECNLSERMHNVAAYYSLCNELAKIAYELEVESYEPVYYPYHPVIIVNGQLHNIGMEEKGADDVQLNYLDAWGANLYARSYYAVDWIKDPQNIKEGCKANIFEVYKAKSSKPLVITEYGADAFYTTDLNPVVEGFVDEYLQATWVRQNTLEIMSASDVCLGGCIMEYSDEWWKDESGRDDEQDKGPAYYWHDNLPDHYANEEYWGIVEIGEDGDWPDEPWNKPADGLNDIKPRKACDALKKLYKKVSNPVST